MNNEYLIVSCYFIVLDYICVDTNATINHNFKYHEGKVLMASRDHRCKTAGVQKGSRRGVAAVGTEGKLVPGTGLLAAEVGASRRVLR